MVTSAVLKKFYLIIQIMIITFLTNNQTDILLYDQFFFQILTYILIIDTRKMYLQDAQYIFFILMTIKGK